MITFWGLGIARCPCSAEMISGPLRRAETGWLAFSTHAGIHCVIPNILMHKRARRWNHVSSPPSILALHRRSTLEDIFVRFSIHLTSSVGGTCYASCDLRSDMVWRTSHALCMHRVCPTGIRIVVLCAGYATSCNMSSLWKKIDPVK